MTKRILFLLAVVAFVGFAVVKTHAMDTATNTSWSWANVIWEPQPGAKYYNFYFKEKGSPWWRHAVRRIPANDRDMGMRELKVTYLKPGVSYVGRMAAVCWSGKECWWSPEWDLTTVPMK